DEGECGLFQRLMSENNGSIPVRGFGSSDCKCPAHLFHVPTQQINSVDPIPFDHPAKTKARTADRCADRSNKRSLHIGIAVHFPPMPMPLSTSGKWQATCRFGMIWVSARTS